MKSMTGYGFSDRRTERLHISVELKSYNNRYLEIMVSLPQALTPIEPKAREFLSERIARGRVELTVRMVDFQQDLAVILDAKAATAYAKVLADLARTIGAEPRIDVRDLLQMDELLGGNGLLKVERSTDVEAFWRILEPEIARSFAEFERTRTAEGELTFNDIMRNVALIEERTAAIARHADSMEGAIKKNLKERFAEVLGESYDEQRLLAETAVLLVKATMSEEISRLSGHLASFRSLAAAAGPCGKKLDFLCQELGREVNTIGSKSGILEVNQAVVDVKDALENIREQLRNVE